MFSLVIGHAYYWDPDSALMPNLPPQTYICPAFHFEIFRRRGTTLSYYRVWNKALTSSLKHERRPKIVYRRIHAFRGIL